MLRGRAVIRASPPLGCIHQDLQQDRRRSPRQRGSLPRYGDPKIAGVGRGSDRRPPQRNGRRTLRRCWWRCCCMTVSHSSIGASVRSGTSSTHATPRSLPGGSPAYARLARHRARFAEERTWSRRWAAWACSLGRGVFGETGASSARGVMGDPGYGLVGDWTGSVRSAPDLAAFGRDRLKGKRGVPGDGPPRRLTVCTPDGGVVGARRVFVGMWPPRRKVRDLECDPQYALHSLMDNLMAPAGSSLSPAAQRGSTTRR
jgi:hypothetical protein